jgi:hypothetical protein
VYIAALRGRQARRNALLFEFVADFPRRTIVPILTRNPNGAQFCINHL